MVPSACSASDTPDTPRSESWLAHAPVSGLLLFSGAGADEAGVKVKVWHDQSPQHAKAQSAAVAVTGSGTVR